MDARAAHAIWHNADLPIGRRRHERHRRHRPGPRRPAPGPREVPGTAPGPRPRGPALRVARRGGGGLRASRRPTRSRSCAFPGAPSPGARRRSGSRPRNRTGSSASPASPPSPRRSSAAARSPAAGSRPRTARSAGGRRSPSSTRTSARRRSKPSSCASPTASSDSGRPVRVWRLCKKAHAAFDGEGARRAGGRWNRRGTPVVYASQSLSLAALELLVHADPAFLPGDLVAIPADVPDALAVESIEAADLPRDWRRYPAPEVARRPRHRLGEAPAARRCSRSPRRSSPSERNFLLNPAHPDFRRDPDRQARAVPLRFATNVATLVRRSASCGRTGLRLARMRARPQT